MPTRGDRLRALARPLGERRGALWFFGILAGAVCLWAGSRGALEESDSGRALLAAEDDRPARPAAGMLQRPGSAATRAPNPADVARAQVVDPELSKHIRALVKAAQERAERESKGKVAASAVRVAVRVLDLSDGSGLVALEADRGMRPASNMKLVTTAAALAIGGLEAQFSTRFDATVVPRGGVLDGDLVVRAGGDPFLGPGGKTDGSGTERLAEIATELASSGLAQVTGDLVLDEGTFEDPAPGPEWPAADQYWKDYCALAGGFSVNGGCLAVEVLSTTPGSPARVRVTPAQHGLRDDWRVETKAKGALVIGFEARLGRVLVRGSIPKSVTRFTEACAHPDPVLLFGHALRAALAQAGIEVDGEIVRTRHARATHELLTYTSPAVDCLVPINTDSTNGVADQLFFATGLWALGDASRAGAARATARALEGLGISAEGLEQVDGSGLSFANRVTAEQLVGLLAAVHAAAGSQAGQRFRESLAVAGRTGTLEERMRRTCAEGRVLAKSGFIRGTSSLSGFVDAPRGPLAFAILVEYPPYSGLNTSVFKPLQDDICVALCGAQ